MDLAELGWRHIDPRLMHRVAVPLLKAWCAINTHHTWSHTHARTHSPTQHTQKCMIGLRATNAVGKLTTLKRCTKLTF